MSRRLSIRLMRRLLIAAMALPPGLGLATEAGLDLSTRFIAPKLRPLSTPQFRIAPTPQHPLPADDTLVTGALAAPPARIGEPEIETSGLRAAIASAKAGNINAGKGLKDPVARVLVEWVALYSAGPNVDFRRGAAFLASNPGFPALKRIRDAVEGALLDNSIDAQTVLHFFAGRAPTTAKGKLALAMALRDDAKAMVLARDVWRHMDLPQSAEARLLSRFGARLTRADHKARMIDLLFDGNDTAALRIAGRLGGVDMQIARAFAAVTDGRDAGALLAQVGAAGQHDAAFLYAKARHLRQKARMKEAAAVMLSAPRDAEALGNAADWSVERRIIARNLLDDGDARTAYRVVALHSVASGAERVEAEFFAGFIALRHLNDPTTAIRHFDAARRAATTPMSLSRGFYWLGRAQEAAGHGGAAQQAYGQAARHSSHYYGQLARARLGMKDLPVRRHARPAAGFTKGPSARAVKLLYAAGERHLAQVLLSDLGARLSDASQIDMIGEIASKAGDARGVLTLGKQANNRGLPFDVYAFPTMGIPNFNQVGPRLDKAVVYAIARQESTFDHKAVSHAGAKGLLQILPSTAKQTARANGVAFNPERLLTDAAYNAKLGSAYLGQLVDDYRGSYILSFAAYNAGGGRVRDWINAYGDPRSDKVDPIDWVERIPFAETRNYVQRVMENTQIYRARLSGGGLKIMQDMNRGR